MMKQQREWLLNMPKDQRKARELHILEKQIERHIQTIKDIETQLKLVSTSLTQLMKEYKEKR